MQNELFSSALTCLLCNDVESKLAQVTAIRLAWERGEITCQPALNPAVPVPVPGRPAKPEMVSALAVDKRKLSTPEGRAALIHSLAHIEFNAINLALDAIYRFRDLPQKYYEDWLQVAAEEASHLSCCAIIYTHWAMTTDLLQHITAYGKWRLLPRTTPWCAWHWCPEC